MGVVGLVSIVLFFVHRRLLALYADSPTKQFRRQLIMLGFVLAGILLIITLIPVNDGVKAQLVGLLGLLLSAAIALSSTTLVGNSMAGIMLKVIKNCKPGDFVRVGDYFGRITEMDLLHTEIQTEDRDLTTLPNLYLATNPVTVMRSSGSIVGVEVSLGYDQPRTTVERLLIDAGNKAGLEEPFVQIRELGDYSVTYRIAGLLNDPKKLLATRRAVRAMTLDTLHEAGVEIVSPAFFNIRNLQTSSSVIPEKVQEASPRRGKTPDQLVFDKAEKAESIENLRANYQSTLEEIKKIEGEISEAADDAVKEELDKKLAMHKEKATKLQDIVKRAEERLADQD